MNLAKINDPDDEDPEEAQKSTTHRTYIIMKIFTILFGIILMIQFTYYSVTAFKDIPNENSSAKGIPLVALTLFRISVLVFFCIVLYIEDNLNNSLVVVTVILSPLLEFVLLFFSIIVIDFHFNIIGLVLQLIYTALTLNLSLSAIIKMSASRRQEYKKELKESGVKQEATETSDQRTVDTKEKEKKRKSEKLTFFKLFKNNYMAITSMFGIVIAIGFGLVLKSKDESIWSQQELKYIGFVGELFLRALSCLIIPMIFTSLVYSLAAMNIRKTYQIAMRTCVYYIITTLLAVLLGIALVSMIRPGYHISTEKKTNSTEGPTKAPLPLTDIFLDVIRNLIPENIIGSALRTYKTDQQTPKTPSNGEIDQLGRSGNYMYSQSNILGIITIAIVVGLTMSLNSKHCKPLFVVLEAMNQIIIVIVENIVSLAPLSIIFLVLPQILNVKDFGVLLQTVGLYTATVLLGLSIHLFIILPLIYFIITRKNPFKFMLNMMSAIAMAFGTSSSTATMSVTMKCLEERNFVNERVILFCIPIGSSVNMDGTALYEAVSAIFIAQSLGMDLSFAQLFVVSITSTLASIGAAGIPQAGLITIVIVLNALGLPKEEAALVMIVDWFLDRFRTVVNVMGDAYGAGVVSFMIGKDE